MLQQAILIVIGNFFHEIITYPFSVEWCQVFRNITRQFDTLRNDKGWTEKHDTFKINDTLYAHC